MKRIHARLARIRPSAALLLLTLAAALILAAGLDGNDNNAQAQQPHTPTPAPVILPPPGAKPPLGNLDPVLSRLVERVEQGISTADAAAADAPISLGASVAVTFHAQGDTRALADFLRANGGDPRNIGAGYIEAYAPIDLLVRASTRPGVIRATAILPPMPAYDLPLALDSMSAPSKGNITSQGVAAHGADDWHAAGYTGDGVKVGVIDVGFTGFGALMGTELPSSVTGRCYSSIGRISSSLANCQHGTNHGTIVAETLMDVAPDATLYISNPTSLADLASTVTWMVNQGVDVINHSVIRAWEGPGDGTAPGTGFASPALKSVDAAVRGGITFVNSAGNYARGTWYGSFNDPNGNFVLNFSGSSEINSVRIAGGTRNALFQLRWDDSWNGANKSLALVLYRRNAMGEWEHVATSDAPQVGWPWHRPLEYIFVNVNTTGTYGVKVSQILGRGKPSWVQLQVIPGNFAHYTTGRSLGSPAESVNNGMLAVGAAHYWNTRAIASYSSRGPMLNGRTKPDITGAACARASRAGITPQFRGPSGQRCWFAGTSASSPHVAGLAALVKDRFPAYTPAQVASYLKTNALARGAKPNNTWGYGFAKLPNPATATPTPTHTPRATRTPRPTPSPTATRTPRPRQPTATPTPTPSPTITPTPTPTHTPIPIGVRLSELERQAGVLSRLISALLTRMDALDGGPTPTPTATSTPTATPRPSTAACVQPIHPGATAGAWTPACLTANPPGPHTYYAKFYTFTLATPSNVAITLSAAEPTYLYLLSGAGPTGDIAHESGADNTPITTLTATLSPGAYTIEATTWHPKTLGDFTLTLTTTPAD